MNYLFTMKNGELTKVEETTMALTIEDRHGWLISLTEKQVRALAYKWGIPGWSTKTEDDLRLLLVRIEGVETPIAG